MANPREQIGALTRIVARRWPILGASFVVVLAPIQAGITVLPELFQSTATVMIEDQQIPPGMVRPTVTTGLETRLQSINQEILTRSKLGELIERFDLYRPLRAGGASIEQLAARMRGDIWIGMEGRGRVAFTISYRGDDPQKVAEVTNMLASMYVEQNLEMRSRQASSTSEFFKSQLAEMKTRLEEIERRVGAFKSTHAGELPHQQEGNLATLAQLNTRLSINSDHQFRLSERMALLESRLRESKAGGGTISPDAAALRLASLKQELRQLRLKYSDKYPEVIRVRAEIEALEARPEQNREPSSPQGSTTVAPPDETTAPTSKELDDARVELKALQAEETKLKEGIATYDERLQAAPLREQQYQVLMRDYDTTSEMYRSLLLREKEAEIAETMERREKGERFEILEYALPASAPAAPDRPRLRVAGLVLAAALAIGIVFLMEKLDGSYHSLGELQSDSEIPVLAAIPEIITAHDRKRRWGRLLLGFSGTVLLLVATSAASYKICENNHWIVGMLMR